MRFYYYQLFGMNCERMQKQAAKLVKKVFYDLSQMKEIALTKLAFLSFA